MKEDIVQKGIVSVTGSVASWGLLDISLLLASVASIFTIIYTVFAILKVIKDLKK